MANVREYYKGFCERRKRKFKSFQINLLILFYKTLGDLRSFPNLPPNIHLKTDLIEISPR